MQNYKPTTQPEPEAQSTEDLVPENVPVLTTLKWFNAPKGFGFVVPEGTEIDAFLHITTLQKANVQKLGDNARLECTIEYGPKGAQVQTVTDLVYEGDNPRPLKAESDYYGGEEEEVIELKGAVKWYRPEKGFGFVIPEDGKKDVFIHKSCLEKHGVDTLSEGQRLDMKVKIVPKGREVVSFEFIEE